jgi:hypothetical protein
MPADPGCDKARAVDSAVIRKRPAVLARRRLPEGAAGMAGLHALIAEHADEDAEVLAGIDTDRGPWVTALVAAGYAVFAVNPLQASRFRERHGTSGAKSDAADAHNLADIVRTDSHQLRRVAAGSDLSEVVRMVARTHKTLVRETVMINRWPSQIQPTPQITIYCGSTRSGN